jgi:hypothetical protein
LGLRPTFVSCSGRRARAFPLTIKFILCFVFQSPPDQNLGLHRVRTRYQDMVRVIGVYHSAPLAILFHPVLCNNVELLSNQFSPYPPL